MRSYLLKGLRKAGELAFRKRDILGCSGVECWEEVKTLRPL